MNRGMRTLTIAALALICSTGAAIADPPELKTLPIGAAAPDFQLPGVDGKTYSLKDFADAKVLVVIFTCNHCPTAQAYEGRIARLHADYRDKGVAVVAISPNDPAAVRLDELGYTDLGDSFEEMKIRAKDHSYTYPYLYDGETQATAKAYGVLATPHVYIFDADRKLRYVGRFDDARGQGRQVARRQERRRGPAGGQAGPGRARRASSAARPSGPRSRPTPASRWRSGTPSRSRSTRSTIDAVAKLAKNDTKKLLVVNLWATWCGPCVAELPELVTMNRMYRGRQFQLVTISMDDLGQARRGAAGAQGEPRRGDQLHPQLDRPRQVRRGPRPGVARPGPLHDRDRTGRQGPLSQERPDRPARAQAGHRGPPRADVLSSCDFNRPSGSPSRCSTTTRKMGEPPSQIEPSGPAAPCMLGRR